MPTACWFSAALAEAESPSAKTGAASLASVIVTVIVWAAVLADCCAVRGGDDDHVVLAAAVGGGRLVVGDAVGLEPELGVAVDLEEGGVGAAGDREGHGVAGVGVGRGEFDHVLDVLRDGGGGARREGRVLVVDVGDRHGDRLDRRVGGVSTVRGSQLRCIHCLLRHRLGFRNSPHWRT